MEWVEPGIFEVDVRAGTLRGTASSYQKKFKDLTGLYADAAAFASLAHGQGEQVVYEVTDHRPSARAGDLITGVTRMSPGRVGDEYFMTRGHVHQQTDRPEVYFCLAGHGVMLMETPDGETRAVDMKTHAVCYVPSHWLHRSVNVGTEDLVMLFCYPADAGQNYEIIARSQGMRHRVVEAGDGGWRLVENAAYRPREPISTGAPHAA